MTDKVVGVFLTEREASEAVEDLKRYGYSGDDISIIAKNRKDTEALNEQTGTKAPEGAAGGAAAGGILGGVGGLLAGLGALAIPGIGPLLAAGPIATTLAGIAVGATGGGLVGGLIGLGIPEDEARSYDEHVGGGRLLVIVEAGEGHRTEVENIFRNHYALNHTQFGAEENGSNLTAESPRPMPSAVDSAAPVREDAGFDRRERFDDAAGADRAPAASPSSGEETMQLRAEQLEIDKHRVRTGEVDVRKEIVREEKTITVPVTHEEVVIERRAVNDMQSDESAGRDETIRIPVSEERIEVNKHNVVTEEVEVGKRSVEGTRHIEDTVKREEARVERTGRAPLEESAPRPADVSGNPAYRGDNTVDAGGTSGLPPRSERPRR
ncbi:YsnF/AvaK domain-containing protein [Saccharibacillus alkalitolerans]|uniref:YsnF/AvaK domain-containing protein n=1 Tax=Saccharibacillus alkalitolerans TaxID=2705290 RepID=A0ABX0F7S9_9BACL|nr:YsnF/AvaK domain-containing protein [Saccharibacillus alkalitolerans]NGZ77017.1 YsnF/AvaK domain-containing protein [Saccharibacillus alkalitolerans]